MFSGNTHCEFLFWGPVESSSSEPTAVMCPPVLQVEPLCRSASPTRSFFHRPQFSPRLARTSSSKMSPGSPKTIFPYQSGPAQQESTPKTPRRYTCTHLTPAEGLQRTQIMTCVCVCVCVSGSASVGSSGRPGIQTSNLRHPLSASNCSTARETRPEVQSVCVCVCVCVCVLSPLLLYKELRPAVNI